MLQLAIWLSKQTIYTGLSKKAKQVQLVRSHLVSAECSKKNGNPPIYSQK